MCKCANLIERKFNEIDFLNKKNAYDGNWVNNYPAMHTKKMR